MPLVDQLFTQIVSNPPVINPGAGGWDAILNQFLADRRGRHGFGLLSRIVEVSGIPLSSTGLILLTCPAGWRCMPLFVVVFAASNPGGSPSMDFTIDSATTGDKMWARDVVLNGGATGLPWDQMPFIVFPSPDGSDFFANSKLNVEQVPVLNGDDGDNSDTFRVNRDNAADIVYSFFTYGIAWPAQD